MGFSKRKVQIVLSCLWFLDGALQLQHQMFTSNFATQVIQPAAAGQPLFVRGLIDFAIHIFLFHPAVFNALIALTQLGIGMLILWKRTTKLGLLASVPWGLFVWVIGEGYGGIFGGHTLLLMGAPGAALVYVLLALAVMPRHTTKKDQDQSPAYWLVFLWMLVWLGGALYQLLPGQNSLTDIKAMILGNASGAPNWLNATDIHTANIINGFGKSTQSMVGMHMTMAQMAQMPIRQGSGYLFILILAIVQVCIGIGVLRSGAVRKVAIVSGIVLSLVFWVVGQSLGSYYTGLATDPNTGPLLVLLGLAILGCGTLDQHLARLWSRIEAVII
jgi:hypothetical protein